MALYFIRHGQTYNNLEGKMNPGDVDDVLTDTGIKQAQQEAKNIKEKGLNFDVIISSHLIRTVKTAQIIAHEIGFQGILLQDARLREQDGGIFKGKKRTEIKREFGISSDNQFRKIFKNKQYNKAEDIREFEARIKDIYNEITQVYSDQDILFVGHSGTYRCLLRIIQNLDFEYVHYQMPGIPNCQITNLEEDI